MARIHAPELEDESWFPTSIRDSLTAFLRVTSEKLGLFEDATPVLGDLLKRHGATRFIDLCSGGGGPAISLVERLPGVDVVLTDLYPNHGAFDEAESRVPGRVRGHRDPISATDVPPTLDGVRTVFNAFHHFRPDDAKKILADAAHKKMPLCILEIVERDPLTMLSIAFVPFVVLAMIPFTRPGLQRLILTYLLPIIPLTTGWDGMASCLRGYSVDELRALTAGIPTDGYRFTVGKTKRRVFPPLRVTWLIGEPTL